jgi:hypothetical protein
MDFYLPSARRNTIVISADGTTFEYFEVAVRLIESTTTRKPGCQPESRTRCRTFQPGFMQSPQGDEIKEVPATAQP